MVVRTEARKRTVPRAPPKIMVHDNAMSVAVFEWIGKGIEMICQWGTSSECARMKGHNEKEHMRLHTRSSLDRESAIALVYGCPRPVHEPAFCQVYTRRSAKAANEQIL